MRKSDKLKKWIERPQRTRGDDSLVYLTEEGFTRLQEQLARLKRAQPDLIAEAQRTAAYGDRSDNAEYKEAKSTLRRAYWRILTIQEQIKRVVIITPGKNVSDTVQLGSTVVLEANMERKTFQIVGSQETDPAKGRISHKSPLGAALMNHIQGDIIVIDLPAGNPPVGRGSRENTRDGSNSQLYRILEIR